MMQIPAEAKLRPTEGGSGQSLFSQTMQVVGSFIVCIIITNTCVLLCAVRKQEASEECL